MVLYGEGGAMDASRLSHQDRVALREAQNVGVERFPLVSLLAVFLRVLGFLLVMLGLIVFIREMIPWLNCKPSPQTPQFGFSPGQAQAACAFPIMEAGIWGAVFVLGLGLVAIGELLGMFRSIEGNTFNLLKVGIRVRRDRWVSVRYAEALNSTTSSVTLQRTDTHLSRLTRIP